jgi:AraC-like DNA-binding protein
MAETRVDPPRGLLNLELTEGRVRLARYLPSAEVGFFVEHYWIVRWDLRGHAPFTSENLPYPSVHLVLERGLSRIVGVPTGKFSQALSGEGFVFGIKFKPGGFHPFVGMPISRLTNRSVPASSLLDYAAALENEVLRVGEDGPMVEQADALLRPNLPARDAHVPMLTSMVDSIAADRSIVRVDQLASELSVGIRALQRLFRDYVGVSPKWVIQRYRLFEAAERLAAGETDGARVAHELGYFDQAACRRWRSRANWCAARSSADKPVVGTRRSPPNFL